MLYFRFSIAIKISDSILFVFIVHGFYFLFFIENFQIPMYPNLNKLSQVGLRPLVFPMAYFTVLDPYRFCFCKTH